MNGKPKPGVRSSSPGQGNNGHDDRFNFKSTDELSRFLIRRQLLMMESKWIQELLIESEADVKLRRGNLTNIRYRVLTSLRAHLDRQEEVARIESVEQQTLKNLPRNAERYIRRRGKQLFASRKPSSGVIRESSDAVAPQGPGWRLPNVRELDAWAAWFVATDPDVHKPSRARKDRIQVALVVSGGAGDLLESTHLVAPVSDHFSCDVSIIAAQRNAGEIVAHNPYVIEALVPVTEDVFGFAEHLRNIPVFDLIIMWRYGVNYIAPPGSRIARADIRSLEETSSELRRILQKYYLSEGRPAFLLQLSREMARAGLSAMNVSVATSGLHQRHLYEIPFFPSKQSLRIMSRLLAKSYVTVHHGFDTKLLPARTRKTEYSSTKNLSMRQWAEIVSLLQKEGVEVIQLGVLEEEKIAGVTHCLNGQTSFEEAALLIKHSLCHIDTEGGLVHLAHAVHAPCVVLFGPTPVEFFGYPQNINLEPSGCKACWFVTQTWLIECPRHTSGPECMSGHSPSSVADAAKRIIAESENASAKLILAEMSPAPASLVETVAMARTLVSPHNANRALLIFDDPRAVGSELPETMVDRSDVILCADQPSGSEPNERSVGRFEYGSLINLPRPSSSIDAAVWVSREVEPDIAPFALREIFRVLKPGGELVFAAVRESTGLDLRHALVAARIGFDEDEMPLTPAYSFALRKNGRKEEGVPSSVGSAREHDDAVDARLASLEEDNKRQIALIGERIARQQELEDEARAIVDDAVQRGYGGDGWIWISNLFADGYPAKFFTSGWDSASDWVIWSRDDKCLLVLPFDQNQPSRGHDLELQLHLTLPETSPTNPVTIGVRVDDGLIENFHLSTDDGIVTVQASTASSRFRGVSVVELHLGGEVGDGEWRRKRAMGVRRFRYRLLNN
jgi:ubiquinone/menaquinone biosynthesis C-methylase UbiE